MNIAFGKAGCRNILAQASRHQRLRNLRKNGSQPRIILRRKMMHRLLRPAMDASVGMFIAGDALGKDLHVAFNTALEYAATMALLAENADAAGENRIHNNIFCRSVHPHLRVGSGRLKARKKIIVGDSMLSKHCCHHK
ncbi:hypothetical protein D3C72_1838320 [compost metagenome]